MVVHPVDAAILGFCSTSGEPALGFAAVVLAIAVVTIVESAASSDLQAELVAAAAG